MLCMSVSLVVCFLTEGCLQHLDGSRRMAMLAGRQKQLPQARERLWVVNSQMLLMNKTFDGLIMWDGN